MGLNNLPSLGTVRAGNYYLLLPIIGFAFLFNLGLTLILILPATATLLSGWKKYPELRKFIALSILLSFSCSIYFIKEQLSGVFVFIMGLLPVCFIISFKTYKKGASEQSSSQ